MGWKTKGREWETLYIIISYMIKAHNQESPSSRDVCGSKQTYSVNQIGFRLHSLHGLSLTRPKPQFGRHLLTGRWRVSLLRRVQSLICPLRGAITVHCEVLHAFEDNNAIWDVSRAFTVPPPTLAQHTWSDQPRHAIYVQECMCVGAADVSGWPYLEIRGEPLHLPLEADFINKANVIALFPYFCHVHRLKLIYLQSECWLSSILHKQNNKWFFSYCKCFFGWAWAG